MNKLENDVFNRYLEIKQDLVNNLGEVFNRSHYYTHKYRGNLVTDINVALDEGPNNERIIQIFVRSEGKWIKDVLSLYGGRLFNSRITMNLHDE